MNDIVLVKRPTNRIFVKLTISENGKHRILEFSFEMFAKSKNHVWAMCKIRENYENDVIYIDKHRLHYIETHIQEQLHGAQTTSLGVYFLS